MSNTSRRERLKGAALTGVGGIPAAKKVTAAPPSLDIFHTLTF